MQAQPLPMTIGLAFVAAVLRQIKAFLDEFN
jgi:hypothetical protein